jgi:dihydrofolate reductase
MRADVLEGQPTGSPSTGDELDAVFLSYVEHDTQTELDRDLIMSGCGDLARTLIANGLVDELRFWVHPAVWGAGSRPYGGEAIRMRLLGSPSFDSGVTLPRYELLRR